MRPRVALRAGSDAAKAAALHDRAHHLCFIVNSVNFAVRCEAAEIVAAA
jgi:organic hydroperoxide reductase OsmC/OhrA